MQFIKGLLRGLLSLVFKLSLVILVIVGPAVMVFGTSAQLKQSLKTSKIYDNLVSSIVDSAAKDNAGQESSPFSQPVVKEAVQKAVSPAFLQRTSEQIIDSMYSWLQGKTPQPQFNIDVSGVKQQFTSAVGDYAVSRAKQLPVCTTQQARQITSSQIDPLTIACVPSGFDIESLRAQVAAQLDKQVTQDGQQKDNLLQQSVISPDSLPKDEKGKTPVQNFTENAKNVPKAYRLAVLAPWIVGGVAVVSGGLVILLYDDKRRGVRNLAITTLVLGVFTLAGIFLSNFAFNKLEKSNSVVKIDPNIKEPVIALMHSLSSAYNNRLMMFGIAYTVIGGGAILALWLTKPKKTPTSKDKTTDKPDLPPQETVKEEAKIDKPDKTLVQ